MVTKVERDGEEDRLKQRKRKTDRQSERFREREINEINFLSVSGRFERDCKIEIQRERERKRYMLLDRHIYNIYIL